jgi:hypothetical protein
MHTRQTPRTPSLRAAAFAALWTASRRRGTGAPEITRGTGTPSARRPGRTFHPFSRLKCYVPVLLCAVGRALAFTTAPALAVAPTTN